MVLSQFLQDLSFSEIHLKPNNLPRIQDCWTVAVLGSNKLTWSYLGLDISASTSLHLREKHFLSQVTAQQYNYFVVTFVHNFKVVFSYELKI